MIKLWHLYYLSRETNKAWPYDYVRQSLVSAISEENARKLMADEYYADWLDSTITGCVEFKSPDSEEIIFAEHINP